MRSVLHILGVGWHELLRILQKHVGRHGAHTEGNMLMIFWVCVVALLVALITTVPWPVLLFTVLAMGLLLLALGWSVRK